MSIENSFHDELYLLIDDFVHDVYHITRSFPKEELYGVTSQMRRAVLSIMINYVEGYARVSEKNYIYFLEVAYGSLQEVKYLIRFTFREIGPPRKMSQI